MKEKCAPYHLLNLVCWTWDLRNHNKGLKFETLVSQEILNKVSNLSPLLYLGLKKLNVFQTKVSNLSQHGTQEIKHSPNQGLNFESLVQPGTQEIKLFFRTKVSNLSPLFDLGLKKLNVFRTKGPFFRPGTQEITNQGELFNSNIRKNDF